jgi:superfamily II DNA or RNA helicase
MADRLLIQKKNEAMMLVGCDYGIGAELSEFFSFFVPGYKYMPAFKNKVWDGKIRLFNQQTQELPLGLLPYVKDFCEQRDYDIEYEDSEYGPPEKFNDIDPKEIMSFIESLDLRSRGEKISVRPYQFDAICEGIRRKRAILLSPTGSGKSLIIYVLMRWFLEHHDDKALVIVPTTSLVRQMYSDFEDYSTHDQSFISEEECHVIYSGQPKMNIQERVFISTWQSIYKLPYTWFEQFGVVFGDECHGFKSKSLTSIMNKSRNAAYRFGTTGTLDGTQTHQLVLEGLFGKVFKVTTTKTLQDDDTLAPLQILMVVLDYDKQIKKDFGTKTYHDEIDFIVRNEKRNNFIRNLALDQKGNTLVLFQFVEKHGKVLFDLIESKADINRKVFFVSGDTEAVDREAIRKITEGQKDAIIVASLGTFSTGINIRNLHNIVFASPSKSQIKVLQSIGRGLRKSEDGRETKLYDIADDLKDGSKKNYSLLHAEERLRIYKNESFKTKVVKVDI